MFDLAALETALANTIFAGNLHFSAVTGSTNTDALEAARAGAAHGSVWFADEQLAGRGRGDHTWLSAAGQGLYVSVLLRPRIPVHRLPLLPLAAGLAAADAVRAVSGLSVDLRWPNDLLIGSRKAGGILVEANSEANTESGMAAFAVIGVGINVHQRSFAADLPPQRRSGRPLGIAGDAGFSTPATSLDLESGRRISRQTLLVFLLESLQREALGLLDAAAAAAIPRRVEEASTWVRGRQVEVYGPQACTGVTAGLDEHGFLLVRTADGLVTVQTGGVRAAENLED
jgi:BirA family biotin operon repressor/biotin-[acetyl-CoA-carboxylase] ligase